MPFHLANLSLLFMRRQAVALVYEHGEGGPTRAVCVDKGLDFTIGEMSSGDLGPLANNRLFRGGEVWRAYLHQHVCAVLSSKHLCRAQLWAASPVMIPENPGPCIV